MAHLPLLNRSRAGRALATKLKAYADRGDVLILALPRGGVPVASEIADTLHAPLDLLLVRKLGTPGQPELAMGAIASGGIQVLNTGIVEQLAISQEAISAETQREEQELQRRQQAYRGTRPLPEIRGKQVILVDDGIATGATVRAAIAALRQQHPARIIVAVPVAPEETLQQLHHEADEIICLASPSPFTAIGHWYVEFPQISDETIRQILAECWKG